MVAANILGDRMSYGIVLQNERTRHAFDEGYVALNFVGAGISRVHKGRVHILDFSCPTRPVLFYRASRVGNLTAPHFVWDKGGGQYRAYTVGEAEIFVFATTLAPASEKYGINIWSKSGKLVYQSADDPILPVARAVLSPGQNWQSGTTRKLAYALHGCAMTFDYDYGTHTAVFRNTVIQSLPGGFGVRLLDLYSGKISGDEFRRAFNGYSVNNVPYLAPDNPISMLIVDVHDLNYQGRQPFTFY